MDVRKKKIDVIIVNSSVGISPWKACALLYKRKEGLCFMVNAAPSGQGWMNTAHGADPN